MYGKIKVKDSCSFREYPSVAISAEYPPPSETLALVDNSAKLFTGRYKLNEIQMPINNETKIYNLVLTNIK